MTTDQTPTPLQSATDGLTAIAASVQVAISTLQADTAAGVKQVSAALAQEAEATAQQTAALTARIAELTVRIIQFDPWFAVDNTGTVDVTDQVQALIDRGIDVPAGRYLIDPVKGLTLKRSLRMSPDAVLIAKTNSAPRYCVLALAADDIMLSGGQILGDRLRHAYVAGSTHEWGYGLLVKGARSTVEGLRVSQCTGDGIGVIGPGCNVSNVVSTQNRRQGMSVFAATGLKVVDSTFSLTGALDWDPAAPNGPCAGVDIEPDMQSSVDATFIRCAFSGNRAGLLAWLRAEVGGRINVTTRDCSFADNANGMQAKALAGAITMAVVRSRFSRNTGAAVRAENGAAITVGSADEADANTIIGMAARAETTGKGIVTRYDLQAIAPGRLIVGINRYA